MRARILAAMDLPAKDMPVSERGFRHEGERLTHVCSVSSVPRSAGRRVINKILSIICVGIGCLSFFGLASAKTLPDDCSQSFAGLTAFLQLESACLICEPSFL